MNMKRTGILAAALAMVLVMTAKADRVEMLINSGWEFRRLTRSGRK